MSIEQAAHAEPGPGKGPEKAGVAESPSRESLVLAESSRRESLPRDLARLGQPCSGRPEPRQRAEGGQKRKREKERERERE